jgi:aerobic carbon-monoxide dehydrogenase large subunit
MDYLLPRPGDVPAIDVLLVQDTPPASNPPGARGVGEVGVSGAGAALANAVADALRVDVTRLPLSPERVLRLLNGDGG